ncbi:MAG: hypothetical protein SGI83_08120 [Bacteroidota bacterium]|nr:hypothetical protein [Bacteroidota bacterium]
MKKIISFSAITALLSVFGYSCGASDTKTEKEVIVVPAQTQPVIIVKEPEKKTTTIILDKNGVKVEGKKIDVQIKNK